MKTKIFISLAVFALFITSCDYDKERARYYLTEAQIQVIPYEKGQVVSFIDNTGQVIYFTVTEIEQGFSRCYLDDFGVGYSSSDYASYEHKDITLKYEPNNFEIRLYIGATGGLCEIHSLLSIVYSQGNGYSIFSSSLHYDVEGNFSINTYTIFHDSIEINGKVYYDVIEQNSNPYDKYLKQLFYNKTYGILQINRDGENFLTINE